MKAFHDDPKIKEEYLSRVLAHAAADEIIKGRYWQGGKGCAVGCTIHDSNHAAYETMLGIPRVLAHLEDRLFENLPNELAKTWPIRFLEAIEVGADLDLVWPKFAHWLLLDPQFGVARFSSSPSITHVAELFQRRINGQNPSLEEWVDAARAVAADAADAAAVAAYAAAYAYADAAYADAAADAADDAYAADAADDTYDDTYDAADAAAAYAAATDAADAAAADAREKHVIAMAEKLLELLRGNK